MRIPLLHNLWDDRPIERWEWIFWPVIVPPALVGIMIWGVRSASYVAVYPEHDFHPYDWGTPEEQRPIQRCRRLLKRTSLWIKWRRRVALLRSRTPRER